MLDRGKADNIVYDYRVSLQPTSITPFELSVSCTTHTLSPSLSQDIFKHCTEESVTSVTEIPYFEGDFWPNIIEDTIKELDQEAREREASEAATVEVATNSTDERAVWLLCVYVCVCVCESRGEEQRKQGREVRTRRAARRPVELAANQGRLVEL